MSCFNAHRRELIETGLNELLPFGRSRGSARLNDAIHYAIFPGGKRMRPIFALLAAEVAGGSPAAAMPAACATEFLHASSLILDDLPSMDDAELRRGRPALHLVFGEDAAMLSALALLNQAYAIFGRSPDLISEAAHCIGLNGMIGGQAADLDSSDTCGARSRKTSALMRLTLTAGAIACRAPSEHVRALADCGEFLGEAYQIYDDVLDEYGRCEDTGKTSRQDAGNHRPNHVAEHGMESSMDRVAVLVDAAKSTLASQFRRTASLDALIGAIDSILKRAGAAGMATV